MSRTAATRGVFHGYIEGRQKVHRIRLGVMLIAIGAVAVASPASARERVRGEVGSSWVNRTLESMTLRERVAQMVMPYIDGGLPRTGSPEWRRVQKLVRDERVGGVIVGKGPATGTTAWLNTLQALTRVPLLVAADLEWGPGTRLEGGTVLPVNMALAAAGGAELAREAGRITGEEARAAGIHMAFAPVADVNVNPLNPVINTRSYGADARRVGRCVAAFIEGARSAGLLTVAKHFPGHGDTETDSHLGLPVVRATRARLDSVELVPFRAAIAADVMGVMTAHIAVPGIEPDGARRPATLSSAAVQTLLRGQLGFGGIIVSDALIMDGVRKYADPSTVAVEAVEAGVDILLMPPNAGQAIDAVVGAVESGRISRHRIDASVRRILEAKEAVGLPFGALVDLGEERRMLTEPAHRRFAAQTTARSITLVSYNHTLFPVVLGSGPIRRVVNVVYDDYRRRHLGETMRSELERRGALVTTVRLWRSSRPTDLRAAEAAARDADVVLFSTYASASPWKGSLGLPSGVAGLAERLAARGALLISFGDPYVIRQVPSASTYLLAWTDTEAAIRAAARALTGEVPIVGRLPVPLPPSHLAGDGIVVPPLGALLRQVAPAAVSSVAEAQGTGGGPR